MTKTERLNEMQNQVKELQRNIDIMQKEIENEKLEFSFREFKNSEFVVNCRTENDANIFLAYLQGKNIRWGTGDKLLRKNEWEDYGTETCYRYGNSGLSFSDSRFYKNNNCKIIKFNISMLNN